MHIHDGSNLDARVTYPDVWFSSIRRRLPFFRHERSIVGLPPLPIPPPIMPANRCSNEWWTGHRKFYDKDGVVARFKTEKKAYGTGHHVGTIQLRGGLTTQQETFLILIALVLQEREDERRKLYE